MVTDWDLKPMQVFPAWSRPRTSFGIFWNVLIKIWTEPINYVSYKNLTHTKSSEKIIVVLFLSPHEIKDPQVEDKNGYNFSLLLSMPELLYHGLLQKRLEEDLCGILPQVSTNDQSVKGLKSTDVCGQLLTPLPSLDKLIHFLLR